MTCVHNKVDGNLSSHFQVISLRVQTSGIIKADYVITDAQAIMAYGVLYSSMYRCDIHIHS